MVTGAYKNVRNVKVNSYEILGQERLRLYISIKLQENVKSVTVLFLTLSLTLDKIYLNMSLTDLFKKPIKLIYVSLWEVA